jgi:hypothetical protein
MKHLVPLAVLVSGLAFGLAQAEPGTASQTRTVPGFHAIALAGTLDVEVTLGKPASVQVTGEASLLDKVTTTVKDGVLVIDTDRKLRHNNRKDRLRAIVTAPDLDSFVLAGTGGMTITGIANESVAISVPGTGALSATGSTSKLRVSVDGTGQIAADDLASKDAKVDVNGTGQVKLRASQSLEARINGTGALDVYGNPAKIKKSVTGTGAIRMR